MLGPKTNATVNALQPVAEGTAALFLPAQNNTHVS